jgi:hypothetical protein
LGESGNRLQNSKCENEIKILMQAFFSKVLLSHGLVSNKLDITFPPCTVRTAKQKRIDCSAFPSILNCENDAA